MFKLGKGNRLSIVPPLLSKRTRSRLSKPPPARNISTETEHAQTQSQIVSPTDSDVATLLDKFRDPTSHFYLVPGTPGPSHEDDHSTSRAPGTPIAPPTPITPGSTGGSVAQEEVVPPVPAVPVDFPEHSRSPSTASIPQAAVGGHVRTASSASQHQPESASGRPRGTSITSKVELVNGGHSRKTSSASLRQRTLSISSSHNRVDSTVVATPGISVTPASEGSETLVGTENELEMPGSYGTKQSDSASRLPVASVAALTPNTKSSATDVRETEASVPAMPKQEKSREAGHKYFQENGYDDIGILEWPVAWGDCDMFQHANNVQFVRWFESARIKYGEAIAPLLPDAMMKNMLRGKGNGIILKDISIKYRLPVTYPDTLLIASKPHSINQERGCYGLASAFWSVKSGALVATGDSTIVFYDYDNLKKGFMPDTFRDVLIQRLRGEEVKAP